MKPALLNVNVLIALIDPSHEVHDHAHAWFARNRQRDWATCPIAENACLRILSHPAYPYLGPYSGANSWYPGEITDLYLVGVAAARKGRLATFDRDIRWKNVTGTKPDAVEVIGSKARN
jgi:predicted nucleic acid-binding protein